MARRKLSEEDEELAEAMRGDDDVLTPEDLETVDLRDTQQARLRAVNLAYDTPKHIKRELTRISSYECGAMSMVEAFDRMVTHIVTKQTAPFSFTREWLDSQYSLRRSIGGQQQEGLRKLAEASLLTDSGEDTSGQAFQG